MPLAPPPEYWEQLPIQELIKAVSAGMRCIIKKNFLPYALQEVSDTLEKYEIEQLKKQLDTSNSLMGLMIRKRINYSTWLTGPVGR